MRRRTAAPCVALIAFMAGLDAPAASGPAWTYDAETRLVISTAGTALAERRVDAGPESTTVDLEGLAPGARVVLGPAGGIALGVLSSEAGIHSVTIHGVDGRLRGTIRPKEGEPATSVMIGGPGRTLLTITEVRDETSRSLTWRWELWSGIGEALGSFVTDPLAKGGFDAAGESLLVIERDRAVVRDRFGRQVGEDVRGRFHKGASSTGGRVVLLGRDDDRTALVLRIGRDVHLIDAEAVVFGVAVAPDGRSAWTWFGDGSIRAVDMSRHRLLQAVPSPVPSLRSFVTSLVSEDGGTAVVAFATGPKGATHSTRDNGGYVARVDSRRVLWGADFPTAEPTAFLPRAMPAGPGVIAWNRHAMALLNPSRRGNQR